VGVIDRESGGGPARRRLGGEPERSQEPPYRMRLGDRAQDPSRAGTAGTDEDLDRDTRRSARSDKWALRRPGIELTVAEAMWA
jgi:hypothetical protein